MPPVPGVEGDVEALPSHLGRFEVLGRLGEGGMGQVLRARDPRLDREVAIKLLRAEVDDGRAAVHAEVARKRLLREAQAMARLDHPNVIGVHEVGEDGGRVFLVMERVAGTTLAGWLAATPRTWREVLDLFAQVGAGLAAAHAAGLVHRDVKPDNVLVGADGRARITDFGLVGVEAVAEAGEATLPASGLTHEGAMVGTPGYMAPEQLRGHVADPRSDQFGFCVALYQALYGESPFAGDGFRAVAAAVLDGEIRAEPAGTAVPAAVRAVVVRGLSVDAGDRWPDMATLLDALASVSVSVSVPVSVSVSVSAPVSASVSASVSGSAPVSGSASVSGPASRGRWMAAAAIVLLGGGALAWRLTRSPAAPPPAAPAAPAAVVSFPLPPADVRTEVASGGCDGHPLFIDDDTLVYRHADRQGIDLRARLLSSGADRAVTSTPDVDEMFPQPAIGERAIVALPREKGDSGAGPVRFELDRDAHVRLPGGQGIFFNPGAVTAGGALYYVLGNGSKLVELRDGVATERAAFPGAYIFGLTIDPEVHTAALLVSGAGICLVDLRVPAPPRCLKLAEVPYGKPAIDAAGRIYYGGISGIRRHDPATGDDVLVVRDRGINGGMAVSPSGRWLVWSECQPQIEITRHDDGTVIHAESLTGASTNTLGAWAFVRETPSASLMSYRDPTGLVHVLTRAEQGIPSAPALSPDSDAIVFTMTAPSEGLWLAHGQSHKPLRKISSDASLQQPVWVDAGHVAVTKLHDDGLPYIHLVDIETGEARQALPAPRQALDRQPDGTTLLLASDDRLRLFLWDPAGGREREVTLPKEVAGRGNIGAALSRGARAIDLVIGQEVWRITVDGSAPARRSFTPPEGKGFWGIEIGPDDRFHVMLSEERGDIYRLPLPR